MSSSQAPSQSQGHTVRSILVGSPHWKSPRPPSCSGEISSSSPRPITPTSRHCSTTTWCRGLSSALCFCGLVIALLLLITVLLFPRPTPPRHRIPCWAESCGAYVRALESSINASRDPCDDFHRYVCDRWRPVSGGLTYLEDAMLAFRKAAMRNAIAASPPPTEQDNYEKAEMLYKSCVTASASDRLGDFRLFLQERRLPWPEIDKSANVLDVSLDLSLNWHLPVFFYIHFDQQRQMSRGFQKAATPSYSRLIITNTFLVFGPRALLEERRLRKSNADHICDLREAMTKRRNTNSERMHCRSLDQLQRDILEKLAGSQADGREESWTHYASLKSFAEELTPSVSAEQWARMIRKHLYQPEFELIPSIPVEVHNQRQMAALGRILTDERNEDLLDFAGLSVVQVLGRFVSIKLATLIYGGQNNLAANHPDVCFRLVNYLAPRLLTARHVNQLLDATRVNKVYEIFNSLKLFIIKSLSSASWINISRPVVLTSLNETRVTYEIALTGETGGSDESPGQVEILPDFSANFWDNLSRIPFRYWDKVILFLQPPLPVASIVDETAWARHNLGDLYWTDLWRQHDTSFARYTAVLPDLYMLHTVFPTGAYESVNYGVVGSLLARQLLAAVDPTGPTAHRSLRGDLKEGNKDKDNILQCVREAFLQGRPNATTSEEVTSDSDIDANYLYALFVAAASLGPLYEAFAASPGYPDWSSGFNDYTADQLFFLAICFVSCGARQGETTSMGEPRQADWCNVPLRLSAKFADAFGCTAGSSMTFNEECDLRSLTRNVEP